MTDDAKAATIRRLNDLLRTTGLGGTVVFTGDVVMADHDLRNRVWAAVMAAEIDPGNDPYGEHDFGKVRVDDQDFIWKIDYYDLNMEHGSEDPADPAVTRRVLSIFYAEDY